MTMTAELPNPLALIADAYPPNTLLVVDRLASESYLLEIQAVAAL